MSQFGLVPGKIADADIISCQFEDMLKDIAYWHTHGFQRWMQVES